MLKLFVVTNWGEVWKGCWMTIHRSRLMEACWEELLLQREMHLKHGAFPCTNLHRYSRKEFVMLAKKKKKYLQMGCCSSKKNVKAGLTAPDISCDTSLDAWGYDSTASIYWISLLPRYGHFFISLITFVSSFSLFVIRFPCCILRIGRAYWCLFTRRGGAADTRKGIGAFVLRGELRINCYAPFIVVSMSIFCKV